VPTVDREFEETQLKAWQAWAAVWTRYAGPVPCQQCGKPVERGRRPPAYAVPTCHACLPPPEKLEEVSS